MADGDGETDVLDISGNGMGAALNVFPDINGGVVGIPVGGNPTDVLTKVSGTDYDAVWAPGSGGGGGGATTIVVDRVALAQLPVIGSAYLSEDRVFGWFKPALKTAHPAWASDAQKAIYVESTSNALYVWVRQFSKMFWVFDWFLDADMIGDWTTGPSTDCLARFNDMQTLMDALDYNVSVAYVANGPAVHCPGAQYCFSDKIVLNREMHLIGGGANELTERTFLRWTGGQGGIVGNRGGSTLAGEASANTGSYASCIDGFVFQGPGGAPVNDPLVDLLYSAIRIKDRITIRNCKFRNWRGVGICLSVSTAEPTNSPFYGNGNGISVFNCRVETCKFGGVWISGGDSNVINLTNVDVANCGRFGMWLSPFLGVYLENCQVDACGYPSVSGVNEYSMVVYGGRQYYAKYDATRAALRGETPGTGDNWIDMGAGSAPTANVPTWTNLLDYTPGGAYGGTGAFTSLEQCYYETGQAPPQLPGAFIKGGFMYSHPRFGGPWLRAGNHGLHCTRGFLRDITYPDGSTGYVALGQDFHSSAGDTSWLDVFTWNSSVANGSNPDAVYGFAQQKATGDFAFLPGGAFNPAPIDAFRITGAGTTHTHGGRTLPNSQFIVEIGKLSVGAGDAGLVRETSGVVPATGFHRKGDKVYNDGNAGTSVAVVEYWLCTVDGTPGTFLAIPPLDVAAIQEIARDALGAALTAGTNITITPNDGADTITIAASGGGGVSDGDKGDITISGSGATYTIDADVVTYAKMQNVSATNRVLGRKSAGAGDVEELTGTQVASMLPGYELLETIAATSGATVTTADIAAGYAEHLIILEALQHNNGANQVFRIEVRDRSAGTYTAAITISSSVASNIRVYGQLIFNMPDYDGVIGGHGRTGQAAGGASATENMTTPLGTNFAIRAISGIAGYRISPAGTSNFSNAAGQIKVYGRR